MKGFLIFLVSVGFLVWGMDSCKNSDWNKHLEAQIARQEALDQKPRLISSGSGCNVYTFKAGGGWHYFTQCSATDTVTTDRHYTQNCGKNCTKKLVETVKTIPASPAQVQP